MSNAYGEVYIGRQIVGHFEYNGSSDIAKPKIRASAADVGAHWRREDRARCTCGNPPTDVVLYTEYGCGFHWPGKACLACMIITDGRKPFDDGVTDGRPTDDSTTKGKCLRCPGELIIVEDRSLDANGHCPRCGTRYHLTWAASGGWFARILDVDSET